MKITRVLIFAAAVSALAQAPPQDAMIGASLQVFGATVEGDKINPVSLVGGIIADAHHVITVMGCCNQTKDGKQKVPVVKQGEDFSAGKLVWTGPGDLAIVETQKELKGPPLQLISAKMFQKGQPAFSVQIPQKGAPAVAQSTADDLSQPEKVPVPVIRVKATSDSVDAGSALFDACGNVMGVNIFVDSGAQFAFIIDPVSAGLQKVGIQARVADAPCGSNSSGNGGGGGDGGGKEKPQEKPQEKPGDKGKEKPKEDEPSSWRMPEGGEWVGVAIVVGLLGLALRRGTRGPAKIAADVPAAPPFVPAAAPAPAPAPFIVPKPTKPALRGLAGQYNGVAIPMEGATVLGRDPHGANLVFTSEADSVSKRHCSIRFDAGRSVFVLEDLGSTNGTFLANGERLTPGQPRELRAGERFYIGDQRNQFELTLE
ncbi:MAG: FHA domain-containing protein [Acidobacteriia bacterium]|nr:FHA domain-containing protein [Terriglobia bacterium]